MSHIGNFFRQRRLERRLTFGQLARKVGYKNLSRGSNRIQAFERGGKVAPDLLAKLSETLEVDDKDVRRMAAEDYRDWLAWANEPVRPYLILRYLACVYRRIELPDDLLEPEEAEAYASQVSKEKGLKTCLVLSRRVAVYFNTQGIAYARTEATPEVPCEPYIVIGNKRCQLYLGGESPRPKDEPGN